VIDDKLPPHLEAIGRQLTAAAHDLATSPRRSRRPAPRLLAASSIGLAAIATAAVLAVSATTATPPAFAVTRHHDGSVAVKINRESGIAGANRKLAAMGVHERVMAVGNDQSAPRCVAEGHTPQPGPGVIITVSGPGANDTGNAGTGTTGTGNTGTGTPGTSAGWHAVACPS
jgi:hypothetical protein